MPLYVWVAIGSAAGGVLRFLLGTLIQQKTGSTFPVGTLAINVTGSLVLGFVVRYALATPAIGPEFRALLTAGLCGGYTTFSTFSYESVALIEEGAYHRAAWYVGLSVVLSLAATFIGIGLAREVLNWRRRL
ncbi:MAG TPA: fluoride efflux transporter CrcB [Gemmatimonadales bacterium]|nr:fluoride efflux transporter CrcB [Gemmatimonadales bacterium]